MYLISLIPALLLAAGIYHVLAASHGHAMAFAVLVSVIVCAIHAVVLVMYPLRHTKPLTLLLGAMACVSILCLFLLLVSAEPNYQVQGVINPVSVPASK